ncbi:MAG: hypothetical protein IH608_08450 [Proteobacteria bacterium]|nr:hypothetical protein [Pseudomonadota bacterium]
MAWRLLQAIRRNKVLLAGLVLSGLAVLALGIWILMTLLSLSGSVLESLRQDGIKGVVDTVLALAQRLWEGAGK